MSGLFDALLRRSALLGAALALVVGFATFSYVRSTPAVATPAPLVERVAVLVARHDLPPHTVISATDVELRQLPLEAVLESSLRSLDGVAGRVTGQPVVAGQQLTAGHFAIEAPGGTLAQRVPEGSRAISVAISEAIAAGGLIAPGDRVDVIAVFEEARAGRNGSALVVDDVSVLAVASAVAGAEAPADEKQSRGTAGGPRQLSATVTLAVSPAQAQRLAVAEEFGALRLIVRRPGDATPTTAAALDLASLTGVTP